MNNDTKTAKHSVKVEQKILDKIKNSTNILVTLSRNPTVDALSSALGLTLLLDKIGKHATTVFSGEIPAALNFLEPEKTFENTVDSLRDFIISLDKEKADRLRLKTEGDFVQVLITPYKTTISKDDLKFEEGEFNVEFVLAIGVETRDDLDQAIAAHGRIFHNAIVATLNLNSEQDHLGNLTWQDAEESATFSEMSLNLAKMIESDAKKPLLDDKIATAFLTGLVAATDQFRNHKTTPNVMKISAELMAKGANQQLIASELSASEMNLTEPIGETEPENPAAQNSQPNIAGAMEIGHDAEIANLEKTLEQENNANAVSLKEKVENENAKIAEMQAEDTRMIAESQLTEKNIANENAPSDDAAAAAEAALDQIAQNSQNSRAMSTNSNNLAELKNLAENATSAENSTDNSTEHQKNAAQNSEATATLGEISENLAKNSATKTPDMTASVSNPENTKNDDDRGETYLGSPIATPMNAALLSDEPPSIDPFAPPQSDNSSPNLVSKNETLKFGDLAGQPASENLASNSEQNSTVNSANENLPAAPELPVPPIGQMPMINSAPITAKSPQSSTDKMANLPPVPPIANLNQTSDLAKQATALAENSQSAQTLGNFSGNSPANSKNLENSAPNSDNSPEVNATNALPENFAANPEQNSPDNPSENAAPSLPEIPHATPNDSANDPTQFRIPGQN